MYLIYIYIVDKSVQRLNVYAIKITIIIMTATRIVVAVIRSYLASNAKAKNKNRS